VDPISIAVEFFGADEASGEVDKVSESLEKMRKRQEDAVRQASEFTDKFGQAANRVRQFADAIGDRTLSRLATFGQRMAENARAGTEFGRIFGPQGALVGGIIGAALPAIEDLVNAQDHAREAAERHRQEIDALVASLGEFNTRAAQADAIATAMARPGDRRAALGQFDDSDLTQERQRLRAEAQEIRTRVNSQQEAETRRMMEGRRAQGRSQTQGLTFGGDVQRLDDIQRRIDLLDREAQSRAEIAQQTTLQAEAERRASVDLAEFERQKEEARQRADDLAGQAAERGERAEERQERIQQGLERYQAAIDAIAQQEEAAKARQEEMIALRQQAAEEFEEQEERKRELVAETLRLQVEAEAEALEEQKDKALEAAEQIADANEARLDAAREQVAGYKEVTDVIVGGLTDALASIADGSKTAEQAFLGLLAGFLKFIAEKAALSAAEEAAQAIAAYARYDYASGAQHTAAAVAYGAVAIAAGAGSAAASSAASSAGRASEPERGRNGGGSDRGGGEIVVNFNAPVLSSDTRAQLGRQIQQLVTAGERYA
jgi:hypothetical protein